MIKTNFPIHDSNYLVTIAGGQEIVISKEEFAYILTLLDQEFIPVSSSLQNRRRILSFEPTRKKTENQKLEEEKKQQETLKKLLEQNHGL